MSRPSGLRQVRSSALFSTSKSATLGPAGSIMSRRGQEGKKWLMVVSRWLLVGQGSGVGWETGSQLTVVGSQFPAGNLIHLRLHLLCAPASLREIEFHVQPRKSVSRKGLDATRILRRWGAFPQPGNWILV
jgi:hypothetical protein